MKNMESGFSYTYSATEQEEIRKIREKYQLKKEDDLSKLRKLDSEVTQKATTSSLGMGIIGTLIMGTGMSFVMTDIGTLFGIQGFLSIVIGIVVGMVGVVFIAVAYPVYSTRLKKEREKVASEILRITEELMK